MHEKSVVDGSSGRGLRGSEKTFCQFVESCWVAPLFRGTTFWRAVGASWKPLRSLWGDLLGPLASLRADFSRLDGPCSPWAAPGPVPGRLLSSPGRPGRPPGPLLAALGGSWASLGPPWGPLGGSWAAPGALFPPKRLLELPRRLQSRSLPKSQNSSTVQRFSMFFGPPGAHLAPPEALLGLSWRPLGPSWRLLGRP